MVVSVLTDFIRICEVMHAPGLGAFFPGNLPHTVIVNAHRQLHAICYRGTWKLSECLREENSLNKLQYTNTSERTMQLFKIDDLPREFQINSLPRTLIDWQSLLGALSQEGLGSQGQAQHGEGGTVSEGFLGEGERPVALCQEWVLPVVKNV